LTFQIFIPRQATKEVSYAFDVLLKYCLGIEDYLIFPSNGQNYIIVQEGKQVVIQNHFFDSDDFNELYTLERRPILPQNTEEEYIPLYGHSNISIKEENAIIAGDIIASTFFLVSQWEQLVVHERDKHGRFKLSDSYLGKSNLISRPLVNKYADILYQTMIKIGMKVERSDWYQPVVSCDVDQIYKWKSFRNLLGAMKYNFPDIAEINDQIVSYFKSKKDRTQDKYYTFNYLIEKAKAVGFSTAFFFKTGISNPRFDQNDYEITGIRRLLKELEEKQVEIGIHPSYESMIDDNIMAYEIDQLSNVIKKQVLFSRQHFLRYNISSTWNLLEKNGIKFDSSIQYTEGLGFSSGICTAYPLFDIAQRRALDVLEVPLVIMKKQDQQISETKFLEQSKLIIENTKDYNAHFMILFHNSDLETRRGKHLYDETLKLLLEQ
jgi:hypothetical protein